MRNKIQALPRLQLCTSSALIFSGLQTLPNLAGFIPYSIVMSSLRMLPSSAWPSNFRENNHQTKICTFLIHVWHELSCQLPAVNSTNSLTAACLHWNSGMHWMNENGDSRTPSCSCVTDQHIRQRAPPGAQRGACPTARLWLRPADTHPEQRSARLRLNILEKSKHLTPSVAETKLVWSPSCAAAPSADRGTLKGSVWWRTIVVVNYVAGRSEHRDVPRRFTHLRT